MQRRDVIKVYDDEGQTGQFHVSLLFSVALRPQRRVGLLGTGTEWEGDERVKGSTAETARKRPERPWTAARTMELKAVSPRHCPATCATAVSTAVLDRTRTRTNCLLHKSSDSYNIKPILKCRSFVPTNANRNEEFGD